MTGEGEMMSSEPAAQPATSVTLSGDTMRIFLNMSETLSRQEENIAKLTDMVDRLTGGVEAPKKIANG